MSWFSGVNLGNIGNLGDLGDLAGAVNKLSESVSTFDIEDFLSTREEDPDEVEKQQEEKQQQQQQQQQAVAATTATSARPLDQQQGQQLSSGVVSGAGSFFAPQAASQPTQAHAGEDAAAPTDTSAESFLPIPGLPSLFGPSAFAAAGAVAAAPAEESSDASQQKQQQQQQRQLEQPEAAAEQQQELQQEQGEAKSAHTFVKNEPLSGESARASSQWALVETELEGRAEDRVAEPLEVSSNRAESVRRVIEEGGQAEGDLPVVGEKNAADEAAREDGWAIEEDVVVIQALEETGVSAPVEEWKEEGERGEGAEEVHNGERAIRDAIASGEGRGVDAGGAAVAEGRSGEEQEQSVVQAEPMERGEGLGAGRGDRAEQDLQGRVPQQGQVEASGEEAGREALEGAVAPAAVPAVGTKEENLPGDEVGDAAAAVSVAADAAVFEGFGATEEEGVEGERGGEGEGDEKGAQVAADGWEAESLDMVAPDPVVAAVADPPALAEAAGPAVEAPAEAAREIEVQGEERTQQTAVFEVGEAEEEAQAGESEQRDSNGQHAHVANPVEPVKGEASLFDEAAAPACAPAPAATGAVSEASEPGAVGKAEPAPEGEGSADAPSAAAAPADAALGVDDSVVLPGEVAAGVETVEEAREDAEGATGHRGQLETGAKDTSAEVVEVAAAVGGESAPAAETPLNLQANGDLPAPAAADGAPDSSSASPPDQGGAAGEPSAAAIKEGVAAVEAAAAPVAAAVAATAVVAGSVVSEAEARVERGSTAGKPAAAAAAVAAAVEAEGEDAAVLRQQLKAMETALQNAARQAQVKADELARMMQQNDELKAEVAKLQDTSSNEAELDALREEYQHRLGAAERKVYALTKERDMLRREQNRKSDTSTLLKEKDEIIKQVMAEGEELSKKQAAQEAAMKKLRNQLRELEEEKQRLTSRLQVEEARVESIRKDKAATEKALQDAVERGQAELAAQKEFYAGALASAKEALAAAEARADVEAKAETERKMKEGAERERVLLMTVEELRQALTRSEQQAAFREHLLRKDLEDMEKRCQAAEARHEELVARMPDSTRPLLRQIEAMQESTNMRVEALTGVERALNARLHEAEAKAAAAEERERATNERLTQTLSRLAVMEAQLSCLRAEQAQLTRSLEKERQRATENRTEYLAAQETAAAADMRLKQLEEELREAKARGRRELQEERARREAVEQELEVERASLAEYERKIRAEGRAAAEKAVAAAHAAQGPADAAAAARGSNGMTRVGSMGNTGSSGGSGGSLSVMGEASILAASLSDSFPSAAAAAVAAAGATAGNGTAAGSKLGHVASLRSSSGGMVVPAAALDQLEALLRQRDGELTTYSARVAALESTRDSLAEELVKTTTECENLRTEVAALPRMRQELEALRRRHTSALELMGERDEQVEELRADLQDVKQMYREQIDMLVGQIERLSKGLSDANVSSAST